MEKFKSIYVIEKWKGIKTPFHKKHYVFDGLGTIFFDSLLEARSYVTLKSRLLRQLYIDSKNFYKTLSNHYFDKLIKFRLLDHDNNVINSLLRDVLDCYRFLSKPFFSQYILAKLKYIYNCFLSIAKILNITILYNSIKSLYDSFFTPYPSYNSRDYKKNASKLCPQLKKAV